MLESKFQAYLIGKLKKMFPGCVVLKNDANYMQGIPDLLVLHRDKWAMLEVKGSATATKQPNQEYYVTMLNGMAFAAFIDPSCGREVLDRLDVHFNGVRTHLAPPKN